MPSSTLLTTRFLACKTVPFCSFSGHALTRLACQPFQYPPSSPCHSLPAKPSHSQTVRTPTGLSNRFPACLPQHTFPLLSNPLPDLPASRSSTHRITRYPTPLNSPYLQNRAKKKRRSRKIPDLKKITYSLFQTSHIQDLHSFLSLASLHQCQLVNQPLQLG